MSVASLDNKDSTVHVKGDEENQSVRTLSLSFFYHFSLPSSKLMKTTFNRTSLLSG
jgi:hypothetical protein